MNDTRITVLGAGSWGSALSIHLARLGHHIRLWVHSHDTYEEIVRARENLKYLPGVTFPKNIFVCHDLGNALESTAGCILAIPSKFVRTFLDTHHEILSSYEKKWMISAVKGIDVQNFTRMSEILEEKIAWLTQENIAVLGGPGFAREVAELKPTALVLGTAHQELGPYLQRIFSGKNVRVYWHDDPVGVELCGALKNIIAIAGGMVVGAQLGHNALSALITRGLVEIARFAQAFSAKRETIFGLAGLGDLVLTCTGPLSRNRTIGYRLGAGEKLDDILGTMIMVAEGITTSKAVASKARELQIDMPITFEVEQVLFHNKPIEKAVRDLLERPLKSEFDHLSTPFL